MRFLIVCLFALFVMSGCATVNVDVVTTDEAGVQTTCKATYSSLFKGLNGITLDACGAHGSAESSTPDTEAAQALLNAASGLLQ